MKQRFSGVHGQKKDNPSRKTIPMAVTPGRSTSNRYEKVGQGETTRSSITQIQQTQSIDSSSADTRLFNGLRPPENKEQAGSVCIHTMFRCNYKMERYRSTKIPETIAPVGYMSLRPTAIRQCCIEVWRRNPIFLFTKDSTNKTYAEASYLLYTRK